MKHAFWNCTLPWELSSDVSKLNESRQLYEKYCQCVEQTNDHKAF